ASSYACRNRYNGTDTPLSEHAFANALDISEFGFESGKKATVLASWPRLVAGAPPPPLPNPTRVLTSPEVTGSIAPDVREKAKAADEAETPKATTIVAKTNPFVAPPADANSNPFVLPAAAPKAPLRKPPAEATPPETASAPEAPMSEFVRKVHQDACDSFGTVLGPEANEAHRDHFHFDMKQRRARSFCQ
ncbi:MAG TPA: extensin family protein, partial [Methyloceanibacter sp.]|nr:extensin family protein [Methyloceanibacter sp.]